MARSSCTRGKALVLYVTITKIFLRFGGRRILMTPETAIVASGIASAVIWCIVEKLAPILICNVALNKYP